ncbi:hypothetical protein [Pollutimonas harenae]|uniref:SCP2 domain-containing protein n=1 Tax=Pollutimonas harenae TaxID=657015 RepID=A0A853GXI1_9BURK|nr:hypothetical protein [Pollutimonas harenae]NYT84490.1 hypothetical protein [Pollutimonas harenae]TEA73114.1 hypothetical protein ERD84_04175 [Pollutimonas harenae]
MTVAPTASGMQLAQRFAQRAQGYVRRRPFNATVLVQFGEHERLLRIQNGQVLDVQEVIAPLTSWDFAIRASADAWSRFWQPVPQPDSHDIFALAKQGELRIEGNLQPLMANLQYIKDVLALGRETA